MRIAHSLPVVDSHLLPSLEPLRHRPVRAPLPRLRSEDLFRDGNNELLIEHRGECYRLRLTRQDKLILNK